MLISEPFFLIIRVSAISVIRRDRKKFEKKKNSKN
jgi:hypothetical protein